jgi:hypothetical protein
MAPPMYASAPTADDRWYGVRVLPNGIIIGVIPGFFDSKKESDDNAQRDVGPSDWD